MARTKVFHRMAPLALACWLGATCAGLHAQDAAMELVRVQDHGVHERTWPRADYVVRSEAQWLEVWAQGKGGPDPRDRRPGGGRPAVDFERFMLVGVSRGQQGHGCSSLYIEEAIEHADGIEVRFVYPGADDHLPNQPFKVCPCVVVNLVDWALLPRSGKPVGFVMVRK